MSGSEFRPKGYEEHPELLPLSPDKRVYSSYTFWWMMFSMNTNIPMFFLGPIAFSQGLNPVQAAIGAFVGNLAATIVLILNGYVGLKYGIPYPVQLRASFGFKGVHIPVILRGIVGAGWFGVEAYGGSLAITMIALFALGVPREEILTLAYRVMVIALIFYIALAIIVMARGLRGIGIVASYGGPLLLLYFVWLLAFMARQEVAVEVPEGVPYTSPGFLTYLAVQTNWWATVALNISDLSRGLKADKRTVYLGLIGGPMVGIVIAQVLGTLLGYYLVLYTQAIYGEGIVAPQDIILVAAPGAVAVILGELFAFIAPFSTDVTANIPPIIDILTATAKLSLTGAAIGAGIIGFFLAPWWAVERGPDYVNYVTAFSANYGVLLGPIAGIMLGNYYVLLRGTLNLEKLYTYGREGYWYYGGFSVAAILSLILAIVTSYIYSWATGTLQYVGPLVFPNPLSWYIGVLSAFIYYLIFAKAFKEL
ncbi:MAG: cytosine permease [Desulfurococcales archaeon]|nr:cytosine permease [Desulfurococcales archaeon]